MFFYSEVYPSFKVHLIPCRQDNYSFVLEGPHKKALLIDCSLQSKVSPFLKDQELTPQALLLTHHHYDHVDGIEDLQQEFGMKVYCSPTDTKRGVLGKTQTQDLKDGLELSLLETSFKALYTPGHTSSHFSFFNTDENLLFCGDLLFSLGCGRVFEKYNGVYQDFFNSLQKIKNVTTPKTQVYCAHEYTKANFEFLKQNDLLSSTEESLVLEQLSIRGLRTVPSMMSFEQAYNPFLRAVTPEKFQNLRELKDRF